jgi:YHS domain-containing protein
LLYFIFWAGFIFLMMRFGCGAHIMGQGQGNHSPQDAAEGSGSRDIHWVPPVTDIDPVCKKSVDTAKAKSSVHDGSVYYFCSRDCREIFEAAPGLYVGTGDDSQQKLELSNA